MLFSSRPPFSDDAYPYVDRYEGRRWHAEEGLCWPETGVDAGLVHEWSSALNHAPRPEFDRPQNNEPNPILIALRDRLGFQKRAGNPTSAARMAKTFLRNLEDDWTRGDGPRATTEQIDHARRVLTPLANLTEES